MRGRQALFAVAVLAVLLWPLLLALPSEPLAASSAGDIAWWENEMAPTPSTTLSGHVHQEDVGDESTPLGGVTGELYCSDAAGDLGTFVTSTLTNAEGWYGLELPVYCGVYNILETDLPGYISVGATSVGGTVKTDNWIQYVDPLEDKTLRDNDFWDVVQVYAGAHTYVLIVDARIVEGISESLERFKADLQAEGHTVIQQTWSDGTPEELRTYLASLYSSAQPRLVGAILIGDLPKTYFRIYYPATPDCIERDPEEVVTFEFYQDLDGDFGRLHPDDLVHAYAYDSHTGEIDNEIWVGVLPFVWDNATTIDSVNRYFAKNHKYRYGLGRPDEGYLNPLRGTRIDTPERYQSQVDYIINSPYSWNPLTERGNVGVFPDNSLDDPLNYPDARYGWEVAMLSNDYDFAAFGFHGSEGSVHLDTAYALKNSIKPAFMWDNTCSLGDIENYHSLDTTLLYADNNVVLVGGATGLQGGLGRNVNGDARHNMAQDLVAGVSFGEAYLNHTNAEYVGCSQEQREYFGAQFIFLGDPSLALQEHMQEHMSHRIYLPLILKHY